MRSHIPLSAALLLAVAPQVSAQGAFAAFDRASEPVLNDPHDLAIGPDGRLYVADKFGSRIAVLNAETLDLEETFGDGQLLGAHDISFDPAGRAHVAVTGLSGIVIYDFPDGKAVLAQSYGGFPRTEGVLAHSNGRIYVMASGTGQLAMVEDDAITGAVAGMPGAHDVAEAPDGTIWVADTSGRRLQQFSPDLEHLRTLTGPQYGFLGPRYLDVDAFGRLVVADQDAHRILLIDPEGDAVLGILGTGSPGLGPNRFDDPEGVAIDGSSYYFSDSDNNRVVKYLVVVN